MHASVGGPIFFGSERDWALPPPLLRLVLVYADADETSMRVEEHIRHTERIVRTIGHLICLASSSGLMMCISIGYPLPSTVLWGLGVFLGHVVAEDAKRIAQRELAKIAKTRKTEEAFSALKTLECRRL
jgi:hypothetical protein